MADVKSAEVSSSTIASRLASCLNEGVMGILALVALATATAPFVFDLTPRAEHALDAVEWVIVGLFALEFAVGFATATDRGAWLSDPWRILDVLTIAAPVVSLLPQVSDAFRSSPVLRLLRLGRAIAFGAKAGGSVARGAKKNEGEAAEAIQISVLRADDQPASSHPTWQDIIQWVRQPGPAWYHVEHIRHSQLPELAVAAGIPGAVLDQSLTPAAWPRVEHHGRFSSLFLWLPDTKEKDDLDVERNGLLLLTSDAGVLTLTHRKSGLQLPQSPLHSETRRTTRTEQPQGEFPLETPFSLRLTLTLIKDVLQRNEDVLRRFEFAIRNLDEAPSRKVFLQQAYQLKGELAGLMFDLWGLVKVLKDLTEKPALLHGADETRKAYFKTLHDEADHLRETAERLKDATESVINLNIAIVGLDMNKFMRLLAVISIMGLFPAVVGGLLGMNVAGNPWPVTLPQVAWGVSLGMVGALYVFAVKGWLR